MVKPVGGILLKKPPDAFRDQKYLNEYYSDYGYIEAPDLEKVLEEYDVFETILKKNVPEIYYLPFDEKAGMDSIYTHDTVKITNNGAVYLSMGKELRRGEPAATRAYLESVGVPTLGVIGGRGRMEGGDGVQIIRMEGAPGGGNMPIRN